jgi:hypothetical protein
MTMRKLLLVVLVVLVLVGLDFGARWFSEHQFDRRASTRVQNVGSVNTTFDQFPYSWNMTLSGTVANATIDLNDIVVAPINMSLLRTQVKDLKIDRGSMLDGKPRVSSTGPVQVTLVLSEANVRDALDAGTVVFRDRYVQVVVNGHTITGPLVVKGRYLVIEDKTHPTKIPLPSTKYLPCQPTSAFVWHGSPIVTGCSSATLPPVLADAVGSKGLQQAAAGR